MVTVPPIAARDVLRERLAKLFGEVFSPLYGFEAPKVTLGFPTNEPPFYCAVDEVAEPVDAPQAATMGTEELDFTLRVWLCATQTDLETASNTLMAYVDAVLKLISADRRLGGVVDNCSATADSIGTAANSSKRYTAAASISIRCSVWERCPAEILEVVK